MVCGHLIEDISRRRYIQVVEYDTIRTMVKEEAVSYIRDVVACDSCLDEAKFLNHRRKHRQV
jgi:hypothetical protein